jgi:hypothetical protein
MTYLGMWVICKILEYVICKILECELYVRSWNVGYM